MKYIIVTGILIFMIIATGLLSYETVVSDGNMGNVVLIISIPIHQKQTSECKCEVNIICPSQEVLIDQQALVDHERIYIIADINHRIDATIQESDIFWFWSFNRKYSCRFYLITSISSVTNKCDITDDFMTASSSRIAIDQLPKSVKDVTGKYLTDKKSVSIIIIK